MFELEKFSSNWRTFVQTADSNSTKANANGEAGSSCGSISISERKTLPEMGTISRKLGVDELPPSSTEAATEAETEAAVVLIGDHEDGGRTGNYILISVIFVGLLHPIL